MIRQAISCDVCGTEKKQTNHWFVAFEHGGELRLSGWNSRSRTRAGSKHLCGQTCLHKLVDEFMARSISARVPAAAEPAAVDAAAAAIDTSLTSPGAYAGPEPVAAIVPLPLEPVLTRRSPFPVTAAAALPESELEPVAVALEDAPPSYRTRNWRAEAWDRERERELRSAERRPDIAARRRAR